MSYSRKNCFIVVSLLAVFFCIRYFSASLFSKEGVDVKFSRLPYSLGRWNGQERKFEGKGIYEAIGADTTTLRFYANEENPVWFYTAFYRTQKRGHRPHGVKGCYSGQGWSFLEQTTETISLPNGDPRQIGVTKLLLKKDSTAMLVFYWYQLHNKVYATDLDYNVGNAIDRLLYGRNDILFVRVSLIVEEHKLKESTNTLKAFVRKIFPSIVLSVSGSG